MIGPLSERQRVHWLRLCFTPHVGPVTFFKLLDRFKTPEAVIKALPDLTRRGGRINPLKVPTEAEMEDLIARHDHWGARIWLAGDPDFPALLKALDPPPPVIFSAGHLDVSTPLTCAIVGSRNASAVGLRFAGNIARALGERDVHVVSGMARGIDGAAHAASLDTGTIAVLAGGLDQIYPPEHKDLYNAIWQKGRLIAERPLGYHPSARDFPRRNRIISGLAKATLVVEASERSGSLITARFALEQNREVMAVPGSPLDPRSKGTNGLIRQGATLIESVDDVMEVLAHHHLGQEGQASLFEPGENDYAHGARDYDAMDKAVDRARETIADLLSPSPISRDELARVSDIPLPIVMAVLVELELAGRCEIAPGGQVRALYSDDFS
ncbi:DNA-processing protein DprA [Woodsholea maritima]|uniref:DNA-processing protein DprA n=1 Tax=Woodsholea maritima TaxID=240237 RepID=UPI0003658449|nr:DNA-processing protein DprA [Woodsholea maritima]